MFGKKKEVVQNDAQKKGFQKLPKWLRICIYVFIGIIILGLADDIYKRYVISSRLNQLSESLKSTSSNSSAASNDESNKESNDSNASKKDKLLFENDKVKIIYRGWEKVFETSNGAVERLGFHIENKSDIRIRVSADDVVFDDVMINYPVLSADILPHKASNSFLVPLSGEQVKKKIELKFEVYDENFKKLFTTEQIEFDR